MFVDVGCSLLDVSLLLFVVVGCMLLFVCWMLFVLFLVCCFWCLLSVVIVVRCLLFDVYCCLMFVAGW